MLIPSSDSIDALLQFKILENTPTTRHNRVAQKSMPPQNYCIKSHYRLPIKNHISSQIYDCKRSTKNIVLNILRVIYFVTSSLNALGVATWAN